MQRADFRGDAERHRQHGQDQRQRDITSQQKLYGKATARKQAAADNQTFKKAFMRRIQTGNVAAGGDEGKQQALLKMSEDQAHGHGKTQHQRLSQCVVNFRVIDQPAPHGE